MAQERIPQGGALAVYDPFQAILSQVRAGQVPEQVKQVGRNVQAGYGRLGGTKALAGRYMPLLGAGMTLLSDPTNIGGAAGTGIGGVIGAGLGTPLGPVGMLAGSAIGSAIGGGIGGALQQGLVGGAKAAVDLATGARREEGKSGLFGGGVGYSDEDINKAVDYARRMGMNEVDIARQLLPVTNEFQQAQMQRQMQLNQQTAQLTGALNRQMYTAQLASGAQQQAGATTRTMMTAANPYASSAFQYRG
jgi:hypothetical protein